jgi:hypothetical protein
VRQRAKNSAKLKGELIVVAAAVEGFEVEDGFGEGLEAAETAKE